MTGLNVAGLMTGASPKIIVTVLAMIFFGPWMLQKMLNYTSALFESIPGLLR